MSFASTLPEGCIVVTDENFGQYAAHTPEGLSKGREARDYSANPLGEGVAKAFDLPLIPRSEWKDRIEEMERTKTRLSDIVKQAGIEPKNQNGTNYCWCNAVITAIEALRARMNLPYVKLSPASVAAPVKGYSNSGGWGGEALEYIVKHGVASVDFWPANAISRQYFDSSRDNAKLHIVTEWLDLKPRSFDQKMTLLLNRIPVPSGYNWMRHEMCGFDPTIDANGNFGCIDRNSWGKNQEWYALSERYGTPDDAVAPYVTGASTN